MRTFTRRHLLLSVAALAVGCSSAPTPEREAFLRRRANPLPMRFNVGLFNMGVFA